MRDVAGDHQSVEIADYFFRSDSVTSSLLVAKESHVDLIYLHFWPHLRDVQTTGKWLHNIISALVVIPNTDDTYMRIAPILLEGEQWHGRRSQMKTIQIA
jgi:hypothetical protein